MEAAMGVRLEQSLLTITVAKGGIRIGKINLNLILVIVIVLMLVVMVVLLLVETVRITKLILC